MIAYGNNVIPEENNDKIYNYFVRPITSESVFMGVLIPSLFMIKAMADFFFGNDMFFLNGAMIVAIILYVAVEIYESEQGMDMLDIVLTGSSDIHTCGTYRQNGICMDKSCAQNCIWSHEIYKEQ